MRQAGSSLFKAYNTKSVTAMRIEKLSDNVTVRYLAPGERAGVRASVNALPLKTSRNLFYSD
jgi:hypothetical protein